MEFEPSSIIQEAKDAIRRYYHSDHDPFVCLDHARRNFQEATENPDPRSNLEALLGLSHTHGYLADIDPSKCTDHTQDAVATAERALSLCEEQLQDDKSLQARAHDTLGCALLQRYVYSAAMEDCDRAIAAHRKSLELTTSEDSPLVRSVRRSHLVRALYIQSRGLRHNRILHKQSLLEAVSMCQKYECNGANTPFTPITGNLLFLCARLLVDGKRSDKGKGKQSQTEGEGEPESIENQLQRTAQAMESNYDMINRFCGPRHTRVAAELGTFGASLLTVTIPDSASDFAARGRSMLQSLMDESFQVDLRYATMLMDLLHTLVTDHESMIGVPTADLVKIIGRRLHRLLPQTHMERPELHYLLGKHFSSDDAQSATSESRNKNVQLAIIQFRKAIALTPDQHPSRAPYLMSLISAQLGCLDTTRSAAQTPEMQNILQEVSELADSLRVVEQSPNISPRYRKEIKNLLAEVGQVQSRMDARSASPVTASLSALSVADHGDLGSKGHSSEGYQATLVLAA